MPRLLKNERNIGMVTSPSATDIDLGVIEQSLKSIPQIQELYINHDSETVSVLVVVPEKDFRIEQTIYDKQLEIIDACPGVKFSLRVLSLRGRKLSDVITPTGKPVFQRTA
jgi:hypothetical protein